MKKAVVFGCGKSAWNYRELIRKNFEVIAYTSNHPHSWGKEKDSVKVIPPQQIPANAVIVVASEQYYGEILHGLAAEAESGKAIYVVNCGEIFQYHPENIRTNQPIFKRLDFVRSPLKVEPTALQMGLSSICNSRCKYCVYHSEYSRYDSPRGLMSEETLNNTIQQIQPVDSLHELALIGDGETFMHPNWYEYACRILEGKKSLKRLTIYSNGMLLTEENARKLSFLPVKELELRLSIDGISPEDCEYWRKNERFPVIRENVNRAHDILGGNAKMTVTGCVVLPVGLDAENAEEVETFLRESKAWREKEFPFAQHVNNLVTPYNEIPGTKAVTAAVFPKTCTCRNPFDLINVMANGDIVSCPCGYVFKSEQEYRIGNVNNDNLLHIFCNHEIFHKLRASLLDNSFSELCGDCVQRGGNTVLCLQRVGDGT